MTDLGPYRAIWEARALSALGPGAERAARYALWRTAKGGPLAEERVMAELARIATLSNHASRKNYRRSLLHASELIEPGAFGRVITLAQAADRKRCPASRGHTPFTKGMPVDRWPQPWRGLWASAIRRPETTYDDAGALGRLAPSWVNTIRKRLGLIFAFNERTGRISPDRTAIDAFIVARKTEVSSVTLCNDVCAIASGLQGLLKQAESDLPEFEAIASAGPADEAEFETGPGTPNHDEFFPPDAEPAQVTNEEEFGEEAQRRERELLEAESGQLSWLWARVAELKAAKTPKRNKREFRVELAYLVARGLCLMDEADAMPFGVEAAIKYRTGLFVAMLGLRCVRLGTILDTFLPQGVSKALPLHGWVDLEKGFFYWPRTKNGRSLRTKIPRLLRERVPRWISHYRCALAGPTHAHAFWIEAGNGGPLRAHGARSAFQRALSATFDKKLWPHLTRDLNTAYICEEMPEHVEDLISDLLGHIRRESASTYVTIAADINAAAKYERVLEAELREAAASL
ncbi:MAG TPA: hypothetical protein VGR52_00340 [Stellaceae bacterium]|nr:hypothetical protein [Stellaceae bacterium]